jgi:acetoin utilization deacetylase AcuC-like enzyme
MKAYYSDTFVLPLPDHHRFPMAKYQMLRERLVDEHVLAANDLHVPDAIDWEQLRLVHDAEYVEAVAGGTLPADAQRRIGFPWSPMMVERSRRSVGATLAAAIDVLSVTEDGGGAGPSEPRTGRESEKIAPQVFVSQARAFAVAANLAGGTHHAFRDHGEGYCVFNDVAVAATVLLRDGRINRAAVVDCDVHQGNGTAAIFRHQPAVFTLSLHGAHNFPFRKEVSDLDVTFEDGAGDDEYLSALGKHLPGVLDQHRPDIVFYLAGADPYEGDRLGRLKLTIDGLRERDRFVFDACRCRAIPAVVAMSGGYAPDVNAIVTIHSNTIREAVTACTPAPTTAAAVNARARCTSHGAPRPS